MWNHIGGKKKYKTMDSTLGPSPQCGITLGPKLEPHVTQRAEPRVMPSAGSAADRLRPNTPQASASWSLNLRPHRVLVHCCCWPGSAFRAPPGSGLKQIFLNFILSRRLNDLPPPPPTYAFPCRMRLRYLSGSYVTELRFPRYAKMRDVFKLAYKRTWRRHGLGPGDVLRIIGSKSGRSFGDWHPNTYVSLTARLKRQRVWRGVHPEGVYLLPVDKHCMRF